MLKKYAKFTSIKTDGGSSPKKKKKPPRTGKTGSKRARGINPDGGCVRRTVRGEKSETKNTDEKGIGAMPWVAKETD